MSTESEKADAFLQAMKSANENNKKLHIHVGELQDFIEKQKETIHSLELAVATLRRRVESLEGVLNP